MIEGWAVKDGNGINVKTVSDTRRAAIVNWLVVVPGIPVSNYMSDGDIERIWFDLSNKSDAEVVKVKIVEV